MGTTSAIFTSDKESSEKKTVLPTTSAMMKMMTGTTGKATFLIPGDKGMANATKATTTTFAAATVSPTSSTLSLGNGTTEWIPAEEVSTTAAAMATTVAFSYEDTTQTSASESESQRKPISNPSDMTFGKVKAGACGLQAEISWIALCIATVQITCM